MTSTSTMDNPQAEAPMVIVVEDDSSMREALETLLQAAGYRCQTHDSSEAFLAAPLPPVPRCLVLDLQLGGKSGLELQDKLNAQHSNLPVLFVSGDDSVVRAVNAMKAGAIDFLPKPFDPEQLLRRVEQALQASVADRDQRQSAEHDAALLADLTEREHEILALLVSGNLNKEVAHVLDISTRTVETHRRHIMEKLEARTLADLARVWLNNKNTMDISNQ